MKRYDAIVIGSGCGMLIVEEALSHDLSVALVDRGPLGGTCLNLGCIPSKMLIYPADRVVEIQEAAKLGITAELKQVDFNWIMERMRKSVRDAQVHMRQGVSQSENLDFYEGEGHFTADYTVEVNGDKLRGDLVFIACGSRPFVPSTKGLDTVNYLTSEGILQLTERPESIIVIGGGYIGVEYGHFFAAMGTAVTILEMADRLVINEEPEISHLLQEELGRRMRIRTGALVEEVKHSGDGVAVMARDASSGAKTKFIAEKVVVAVGRRSNADLLRLEKTGVATDEKGFIKVNEYMETGKRDIFAVGDANGRYMFTHVANREAQIAAHNALHGRGMKMDYSAVPHAVYSHPQIAAVGLTGDMAKKSYNILVGRSRYFDVANGEAMMEEKGFAKAVVEKKSGRILGFHIIGPLAPILVQEVTNAIASGGHLDSIRAGIHIHPALSELIEHTLSNLTEV